MVMRSGGGLRKGGRRTTFRVDNPQKARRDRFAVPEQADLVLDMVYLTPRVILMAIPRTQVEERALSAYLRSRHPSAHSVYSCSAEVAPTFGAFDFIDDRTYLMYPNTPGVMDQILKFCVHADAYLSKNENNTLCVCCRTGKNRSAMLAAILLLHQGVAMSSTEAIAIVNKERTSAARNALTLPSQIRYVHYYEALLRSSEEGAFKTKTLKITNIRINTIPNFDSSLLNMGSSPFVVVSVMAAVASLDGGNEGGGEGNGVEGANSLPPAPPAATSEAETAELMTDAPIYTPRKIFNQYEDAKETFRYYSRKTDSTIDLDLTSQDVLIRGDTVLTFFSDDVKMMQVAFHTAFVEKNYLAFEKGAIDIAYRDTKHRFFDDGLKLEVFLTEIDDDPSINIAPCPLQGYVEIEESDND